VLLILLAAAAGGLGYAVSRPGAASRPPVGSHAGNNPALGAETVATAHAVAWILHQVSGAVVVSCDSLVCADLASRGFLNLMPLGQMSNDPEGSRLVVATAAVRDQFGRRLATVWAPAIIASFGAGKARIEIRLVYSGGAKSYHAAEPAALRARKAAEAQMLANGNIILPASAKAQIRRGEIDPRLAALIAFLAAGRPLRIVDLLSQSPGGGPASLLRWVDLSTAVPAAHLPPAASVRWGRSLIHSQRAQYRPAWVRQVRLRGGRTVLRIGYGAPSPLT
jgi:hypothetical protein